MGLSAGIQTLLPARAEPQAAAALLQCYVVPVLHGASPQIVLLRLWPGLNLKPLCCAAVLGPQEMRLGGQLPVLHSLQIQKMHNLLRSLPQRLCLQELGLSVACLHDKNNDDNQNTAVCQ